MGIERTKALKSLLQETQGFAEGEAIAPHDVRFLIGALAKHLMAVDQDLADLEREVSAGRRPAPPKRP